MRSTFTALIFIITLGITVRSHAQLLVPLKPRQYAFTYTNGFYGNVPVFSVSVARTFHIHIGKLINEHATLFLDFADRTNFHDNTFQFIYGGQGYLFRVHSFKFMFRKTFTLNRYVSDEFKGTFLGGELDLCPGFYKKKYFVAADLYFGDSFTGHVVADPNVQHVLKDVESGWITPHFATLKTGINLGYYIKEKFLIQGHVDYTVLKPEKLVYTPSVYWTIGFTYIINRKNAVEKAKTPAVFEDVD
ncbi:hypothetical protein [Cytophaga aurantiaca]|uniref:hypothetical protein n=1 Tax=Cytophaga aurantiaca TaxID=29530 RepID=UPI0003782F71|nr:hypothetical protein [Cytophaga aurantiaca]